MTYGINNYGSFSYVCDQNFRNSVVFICGKAKSTIFYDLRPVSGEWGFKK